MLSLLSNPLNKKTYSSKYFQILESRKKLPVFEYLDEVALRIKNEQVKKKEDKRNQAFHIALQQFYREFKIPPKC